MDRHWSVGDLAAATLRFALHIIEERTEGRNTLFEEIIGMDKPSPQPDSMLSVLIDILATMIENSLLNT